MPLRPREPGTRAESDYVVVGHVTVDRLETGRQQPGGTALYSAVLAARCGLSVSLVTAGSPAIVATALGGLLDTIDVVLTPADTSTTLLTWYEDGRRRQRVLAAAPMVEPLPVRAGVLHLAPILDETPPEWLEMADARVSAITPQGLIRRVDADGDIRLAAATGLERYAAACVAVLSEHEIGPCARLTEAIALRGGSVVVTQAGGPAEVRVGAEEPFGVPAVPTEVVEDLGAGDVFAAALLVALRDGQPIAEAVRFAHAAASLRLAGRGLDAVPARTAIDRRLAASPLRDRGD